MTKQEFKQFIKQTSGGIRWIENHILVYKHYNYKTNKIEWIPMTDSSVSSNWMVGIEHKYQGCIVYMWFRIYNHDKMSFHLNYIWKPGIGKKMRRDAAWNLEYSLSQKAGIYEQL